MEWANDTLKKKKPLPDQRAPDPGNLARYVLAAVILIMSFGLVIVSVVFASHATPADPPGDAGAMYIIILQPTEGKGPSVASIREHLGESGAPGWIIEDMNEDGLINVLDMIMIGQGS